MRPVSYARGFSLALVVLTVLAVLAVLAVLEVPR
jgi:Tfp pilus assembly protein FimT